MPSILQKKISPVWLLPLFLIGLPFLLAAAGRVLAGLGAAGLGDRLVNAARAYGNLPIFLLGLSPFALENSVLAYVAAGVFYSGIVYLLVLAAGVVLQQPKR
ncbi:MAG: hypothetical protein ABIV06_06120 [Thermoanaerobaculia bacterium]